ncbi:MAG: PD40 domain-containing protein [Candidatus Aminicenantes bacterium]|nr:PD40 domain-containing protein [Candidatus Aminicenantes bacterium]
MNQKVILIGFASVIVMLFSYCTQQSNFPKLSGPYLGQKPPGMTPEIFAPGIISTGMSESAITVSPDGNEIFYTVHAGNSETIVTTRLENGIWTAPEVATFSGKYLDGFPAMHPDGSKLYFHSYRPLNSGEEIAEVVNIWFVEREGNRWSEPKPVGPPVNGDGFVCCPSITRTGTLYYSKKTKDGGEKIYRSRYVDGQYLEPEELPPHVNSEKDQFHAVISPDETYLILPREEYLVSFRDEADQWTELISLREPVNEHRSGWCPSISSDGRYFFFAAYPSIEWKKSFEKRHTYSDFQEITLKHPASERTDIFWVDTKIIEELRLKELKSLANSK